MNQLHPTTTANGHQLFVAQAFLDALGVAVYTTDAAGTILQFNDAAAELWGRRPVIGKDQWCGSWRLFYSDGRPMAHEQCPMGITLQEGRAVRGMEGIAERPDGTRIWFLPYPTPVHDADGLLIGAVNVFVDISDRRRVEESASYLTAIITSSDDAIVSKDLQGVVTSWNAGAERLFGYSADEMVGRSIRTIIPPDRQAEEDDVLSRVNRGERVDHFETIRLRKDGTEVAISLTISPVRDRQGKIIGVSKIARDITERREADRKLAEALAVKDEFIGLVSHELRTPLTTVMGNSSILAKRDQMLDQETRVAAAEDVYRQAVRLNSIVEDLLSLARLDNGAIEREPTSFRRVIERGVREYTSLTRRQVDLHIQTDDFVVAGDEHVIGHILNNYLSNAEKYSPRASVIDVVVECIESEGRLRVLDRGIGVHEEEASRLFESFYRSKDVGHVSGIGVGLSVCRRLADAIGGRCWASPRDGGGSEFGFALPLELGSLCDDDAGAVPEPLSV